MNTSAGRHYYDRKISAGETHKAAMRCLKRKIVSASGDSCSPTNDTELELSDPNRTRLGKHGGTLGFPGVNRTGFIGDWFV